MPSLPEWTYKHAAEVGDHWSWRPGWQVGTRFYTWHITFDGQDAVHNLVDTYQADIAHHAGFDLVPADGSTSPCKASVTQPTSPPPKSKPS